MITKYNIFVFTFLFLLSRNCVAQDSNFEQGYKMQIFDINLNAGKFSGIMNENFNENYNFGLGLSYQRQFKENSPVFVGIDVNFQFLDILYTDYTTYIDNEPVDVQSSTSTFEMILVPKVRYYLPFEFFKISPFAELGLGYKWIFTSNTLDYVDSDDSESDIAQSSGSLGYYFGGGFNIGISESVFLLAKIAYSNGNSATYLVKNKNIDSNSNSLDSFSKKSSPTNMWLYQLGVSIFF
ncbi:MAG TPA: hypothetical protein P5235_02430 [Saprospiraceae bacterium]|nr:hypothetical protein [Saprospiraceae bacterium]